MILPRILRRTMASKTPAMETSAFTKQVVASMRKLYPEALADSSFDNTGLLLEAPCRPESRDQALLTIDLTRKVVDEAISKKYSIVVAYHPIIFRGLKSLTSANTQQISLLRLAQAGISVYCPHTALDAARGGLNDWLADVVCGQMTGSGAGENDNCGRKRLLPVAHTRNAINPITNPPQGFSGAGYGRIVKYEAPQKLGDIITCIMENLFVQGGIFTKQGADGLNVALKSQLSHDEWLDKKSIAIKSVGICAGSGGSMLKGLDVDLLFTGELSHHDALEAVENGRCVITAGHSNTERNFLDKILSKQLLEELKKVRGYDPRDPSREKHDSDFGIDVTKMDFDPYEMVRQKDWFDGKASYGW